MSSVESLAVGVASETPWTNPVRSNTQRCFFRMNQTGAGAASLEIPGTESLTATKGSNLQPSVTSLHFQALNKPHTTVVKSVLGLPLD
jgi:hypothetical protein